MPKKPSGFVAKCQCGSFIGALDITRTDRNDMAKLLGYWLMKGCTVEPRFGGTWRETIASCRCTSPESEPHD